MPDSKITALTAITTVNPATFPLVIVDTSDTSMAITGTTKKVTTNQLLGAGGTATLASATITGDLTVRTNKLVVNATGVGAGKTPSYPLDVAGNVSMTGAGTGTRYLALMDETNTYAGSLTIQAGGGSAGFGGGIVLYGHSHATYPGAVWIGRSSTSSGPIMFGDYGTGPGNKFLQLDTGGVCTWYDGAGGTRMTLNANGLGIGVTPSAWGIYKGLQVGYASLAGYAGSDTFLGSNVYFDGGAFKYISTATASNYRQLGGGHLWNTAPSGTAGNAITFTQAMTLDASGNLSVGTTNAASVFGSVRSGFVATGANGAIGAKVDDTGRACLIAWNADTSGDNSFIQFFTEASITSRGSISYNRAGGLVAYNTTSDYRAKDIIGPVSNSGSLIDSLKVYAGKMKGATIERPMLIAHEAQEVAPYAVTGTKDEVDADGKPKYQQMDASALVPLLIAEIQSLRARVQTLETR